MSLDNAAPILVITDSVRAKFVAANIIHSFEQPNVKSVCKLKRSIAEVFTSFPTTLFGSRFGDLALALIQEKMCRVNLDASLDCSYTGKPDQVNPDIEDADNGKVILTNQKD